MSKASIYAIGADWGSPIKIGVAADVERRLERLQSGNHITLAVLWHSEAIAEPFAVEAALHQEFDAHRIRGEWFAIPNASPDLLRESTDRHVGVVTSRRHEPKADTCAAAIMAVKTLVAVHKRDGLSTEQAIGKIASEVGTGRSTIWALLYRPPGDLWASQYGNIALAVFRAAGKPGFDADNLPSPLTLRLVIVQLRHMHGLPDIEDRAALVAEAETALGIEARRTGTNN